MLLRRYPAALKTVVGSRTVPYGYTLTVWSSGAVLMHAHGTPTVGDVFLFALGAVAGFAMIGLLVLSAAKEELDASGNERIAAGIVNALAVCTAIGAAALIALIPDRVDWLLAAFAATAVYLGASGLELAFAHGVRSHDGSG